VVGNNGAKGQIEGVSTGYPAIIQRMIAEGHQVASHTWSHQDLTQLTHQQRVDQVIKNEIALVDILGFFPTYLRPPYEDMNADVLGDLNTLGYHVVSVSLK
jgi:peptidoglycan/xylan/chitin deacetylase (PgdA/CDA1 family)